jgi:hypothetical protein
MSERMNNPEKEPRKRLVDDCSGCGERYVLESGTVDQAYWFADSPRHSFARCQCPNCNYRTIIFLDEYGKEALIQHGVDINETMTTPPQTVIDVRAELDARYKPKDAEEPEDDYVELPTYELTPRLEAVVERFGRHICDTLDNVPDIFWDEMNSPQPPTTMPPRWIN